MLILRIEHPGPPEPGAPRAQVAVFRTKSPAPSLGYLDDPSLYCSCGDVNIVAAAVALNEIVLVLGYVGDQE